MLCVATNGRGVHILKPGSKRRRTKTEMGEQLDEERASMFDREGLGSKVREQNEQIEKLRAELEQTK